LDLVIGRTRLLNLKATPKRIQMSTEGIADYNFLTDKELLIQGIAVGEATVNIWFEDPKDPSKTEILSFQLRVLPSPIRKEQLIAAYKALEREINCSFPNSVVCLGLVGDKLIITGQAHDVAEAAAILQIVRSNAPAPGLGGSGAARIPVDRPTVGRDPNNPTEATGPLVPGYDQYVLEGANWIVNLLKVPGEQTVNMRVTIAEVNRTAARSIGVNFTLINNNGMPYFASNAGTIATGGQVYTNGINGLGSFGAGFNGSSCIPLCPGLPAGVGGFNNLPVALDNGQVLLAISALRNLNYAKLMAEPNLTTLNGQTATFRAGGEYPVPVLTTGYGGGGGYGLVGTEFRSYGINISFTPYITDRDRIRLVLNADISALDVSAGSTTISNSQIPYTNNRSVNTAVEMREGQVLAVAGLIQNNLSGDSHRVPLFGDIPILGNLFGFSRVTAGEQELVILVQPELVHPLDAQHHMPLPGQDLHEPTDCEFYLFGRIESHRDVDYRSPIRSDWSRIKGYKMMEATYVNGPTGYTAPCGDNR